MRIVAFFFLIISLQGCNTENYIAEKQLSRAQHDTLLLKLAPYVNKKPKGATYPERFTATFQTYYEACVQGQESRIPFFYTGDSLHYFYYVNKDLTSLYEHYKGYGGSFRQNKDGNLSDLTVIFTTPRFTGEEITIKGKELFLEMIQTGNIDKYKGNRQYVHLPNADFEYNKAENRWVYTENSSWNFLKEVKGEEH